MPPLQVVIDSALTRNGMRKFRNQEIGARVKVSIRAHLLARNLNFVAETSYGI
jgi:hypothetical protein